MEFYSLTKDLEPEDVDLLSKLPKLRRLDLFGIRSVSSLRNLRSGAALLILNLNCTAATDSHITCVSSFSNLITLEMMDTAISDAALKEILKCRRIKVLRLDGNQVSPDGVIRLCSNLPISRITLDGAQASASCLEKILPGGNLIEIDLFGNLVTDEVVAALKWGGKTLRRLGIIRSEVTDDGLEALHGLERLESLALVSCGNITSRAVHYLIELRTLKFIWLSNTSISKEAREYLQTGLPLAEIGP